MKNSQEELGDQYYFMAIKLLDTVSPNKAITQFGKAIEAYEKAVKNKLVLIRLIVSYQSRGLYYGSLDKSKQAIDNFTAAISTYHQLEPEAKRVFEINFIQVLWERGIAYLKCRKLDEAFLDCTTIIELLANVEAHQIDLAKQTILVNVYQLAGGICIEWHKYKEAISNYEEAIKVYTAVEGHEIDFGIQKTIAESYSGIGNAYAKAEQKASAVECYSKAIDHYRTMEAIENYQPSIKTITDMAIAYGKLALYSSDLEENEFAIINYTTAIKLFEMLGKQGVGYLVAAYNNRGGVYGVCGQYTDAVADYTKVLELTEVLKKDPLMRERRINAYVSLGMCDMFDPNRNHYFQMAINEFNAMMKTGYKGSPKTQYQIAFLKNQGFV